MIEVVVEKELSEEAWTSIVSRCDGHALHLPAIHLVHQEPEDLRHLVFRRGGDVVACALALESSGRRRRWALSRPRTLHLPTAPAVAAGIDAWPVWTALLAFAAETGCERLGVDPSYSRGNDLESLASYRSEAITEFVIDLRDGEEAVLGRLHKQHRKNIRRAQRQSLQIEEDSSLQGLLDLRDLQLASSERASERAEGFAVGQETFFERLHDRVYSKGIGHVVFASLEGERVAALAWVSAARRVQTVRSGSLPSGYQSKAMYLLHDHLIRRVIGEGAVELNIGGVPAEAADAGHAQAGLYEFKNGFGGVASVRYGLDIPLKEWSR